MAPLARGTVCFASGDVSCMCTVTKTCTYVASVRHGARRGVRARVNRTVRVETRAAAAGRVRPPCPGESACRAGPGEAYATTLGARAYLPPPAGSRPGWRGSGKKFRFPQFGAPSRTDIADVSPCL